MSGIVKTAGGLFGDALGSMGATSSFQAGGDLTKQNDLLANIGSAQQGYQGLQSDQSALAQALMAQSQGQGPNPAALQMQQAQDRANQQGAGLIASAKGINPALAARMAAQQTAAGQQQNVQNTGILGAQQQMAAQGQLGSLYGQMGQQNLAQQNILQGAISSQNANSLGAAGINAGTANNNASVTGNVLGGIIGAGGAAMAGGMASGGYVDGPEVVGGDSKTNDVVPIMASAGEIVIPKSQAGDAESAKAFIDHLLSHDKKKKSKRKVS